MKDIFCANCDNFQESRVREIRKHGLKRGKQVYFVWYAVIETLNRGNLRKLVRLKPKLNISLLYSTASQ